MAVTTLSQSQRLQSIRRPFSVGWKGSHWHEQLLALMVLNSQIDALAIAFRIWIVMNGEDALTLETCSGEACNMRGDEACQIVMNQNDCVERRRRLEF
jgi:hypothetical protein